MPESQHHLRWLQPINEALGAGTFPDANRDDAIRICGRVLAQNAMSEMGLQCLLRIEEQHHATQESLGDVIESMHHLDWLRPLYDRLSASASMGRAELQEARRLSGQVLEQNPKSRIALSILRTIHTRMQDRDREIKKEERNPRFEHYLQNIWETFIGGGDLDPTEYSALLTEALSTELSTDEDRYTAVHILDSIGYKPYAKDNPSLFENIRSLPHSVFLSGNHSIRTRLVAAQELLREQRLERIEVPTILNIARRYMEEGTHDPAGQYIALRIVAEFSEDDMELLEILARAKDMRPIASAALARSTLTKVPLDTVLSLATSLGNPESPIDQESTQVVKAKMLCIGRLAEAFCVKEGWQWIFGEDDTDVMTDDDDEISDDDSESEGEEWKDLQPDIGERDELEEGLEEIHRTALDHIDPETMNELSLDDRLNQVLFWIFRLRAQIELVPNAEEFRTCADLEIAQSLWEINRSSLALKYLLQGIRIAESVENPSPSMKVMMQNMQTLRRAWDEEP